ncbi:MAG: cadmium-translocating P-type ATPase [Actinomycetota bacterium]|jgi:Cu+-exporting ATPase
MPKQLELDIEGMTCTACARRVEKGLNSVDGVSAYVDFATEKAHLTITKEISQDSLRQAVDDAGYKVGNGKPELSLLIPRIAVGAVLSILAVVFSMIPGIAFEGSQYLVWALATPVVAYVAFPFHSAALKNLRHLDTTMDTLVSLGAISAYFFSVYLVLDGHPHHYFEVAAVVPTVVLIGRFLEVKTRRSATDAVRSLLNALPTTATVLTGDRREEVGAAELKAGDLISVAAGQAVPADGVLHSASASIDNSTLTGETLPVELTSGGEVSAGAIVLSGEALIRVSRPTKSSRLAQIADLVREATAQKTKLASLADSISKYFVPSVIVISVITFVIWLLATGDELRAFEAAVAVLVIACPCALGIAVPMSLVVATSVGAKKSVVIRNPDSLRKLAKIKKVIFDKTGTLTDGKLVVVRVNPITSASPSQILEMAGAVEKGSNHPIAKALSQNGNLVAENILEVPGVGLSGIVSGKRVTVGSSGDVSNQSQLSSALADAGPNTLVIVAWDNLAQGVIELSDSVREGSKETIEEIEKLNLSSALLSGDNPKRVEAIAKELGITEVLGGVTPEQKLDYIRQSSVLSAMVGDGINDVAALSAASIGVAMGSGAQAAQAASDITVLDDDPRKVPFALRLGRRTYRNILQNLGWAFGYNLLLIPVAAAGLLNPMLAGLAMAFSSVSVVLNSLRLKWQD